MDCGCHQDPFSVFSRKCEDSFTYMVSCALIKQTVISTPGCDMDLLLTYHIMESVCINTGCIYHVSCLENSMICMDLPALIYWFKIRNFCIKFKFHTIGICILCHCHIHTKRTYNTGCRCIKRSVSLIGNIRLHFLQFLTVKNP